MANGDIAHADIESFISLGADFPASSDTSLTETEVDTMCSEINSDVNLILKRLGFSLPVTDSDSIAWLTQTKKFGAAAIVIHGLAAQDSEEENTRADWYWDKYQERLQELIDSGGDILEADVQDDPRPSRVPMLSTSSARNRKRFLRFPQRAAADQYTDEATIDRTRADWKRKIEGY